MFATRPHPMQAAARLALPLVAALLAGACATKAPAPPPQPTTPYATTPGTATPATPAGPGITPASPVPLPSGAPAAAAGAGAAATPATPVPGGAAAPAPAAAPPVIEPQVARRDLKLPSYPSRDIEVGLFTGTYSTQNFGSNSVSGLRLGYHITEDFFVSAQYGQTKVSDDSFRQILPGGVFVNRSETLKYYTLAMGYNLLPGEVFFGAGNAKLSQGYVLVGAGTTDFAGQRKQTIDLGFGLRLLWNQRLAAQAEVRDHLFSLDLLGRRESTHNPEITFGLTLIF
ncbi:MAG: outer membrane beta-barrel domain-containing protein [Rubrivivax sp.]|nr:outer membrane beta-barrel domain-containing protein [Rubrivivax sp.]